jgi:dTDP-4-dehydrorhamnose reductase
MKKILVTGATGQLGREFNRISDAFGHFDWILTDRNLLNLLEKSAVSRFFSENEVDCCINCAAYTDVNLAESEPQSAYQLNVDSVQYLAMACHKKNIPLIHFSTDYVYHNNLNRPLLETDITSPQSIYARSKLGGELIAAQIHPLTMIIRTSWLYSGFGNNFLKSILRASREKDRITVVYDQIGTPTYARDLAECVCWVLNRIVEEGLPLVTLRGIFNYSNEGVCSWYDFARSIVRHSQLRCQVLPIETRDYPTPAKRPHYSVLNKRKIKKHFGIKIRHWEDGLLSCLQDMGQEVKQVD